MVSSRRTPPAAAATTTHPHATTRLPRALSESHHPTIQCGLAGGSTQNNDVAGGYGKLTIAGEQGFPGSKLEPLLPVEWVSGQEAEVAWSIAANHGGGYIFRLCAVGDGQELTEECFWQNVLPWAGNTSALRWRQPGNAHEVVIAATRTAEGMLPAGSVWTRNPIPPCDDYRCVVNIRSTFSGTNFGANVGRRSYSHAASHGARTCSICIIM